MIPRARRRQGGFSLVEIVVALTVLSVGSAVLWYTLRSAARLERLNRLHHAANLLARSEVETLRAAHREEVRDTSYRAQGPGGVELLVVREVFDSADIANTLEEVALDERLSPLELRKPPEVRVRVFMAALDAEEGGFDGSLADWADDFDTADSTDRRTLSTLLVKLPEYRWY